VVTKYLDISKQKLNICRYLGFRDKTNTDKSQPDQQNRY